MQRAWLLTFLAACLQKPPHATVHVEANLAVQPQAVLALPTKTNHGKFVDAELHLRLEFAGYTLAEAGAMRLTTADRVDVDGASEQIATDGPQTVAELGMPDIRAVARSLGLQAILIPHLAYGSAGPGETKATLSITLVDVATMRPLWTVACDETLYDPQVTMNRLANCAGNGVLAIFAPANVIGQAR